MVDGVNVAEENTFAVGDVVRLKSGGPRMTINELAGGGNLVEVLWFDDACLQKDQFLSDTLVLSRPPKAPFWVGPAPEPSDK